MKRLPTEITIDIAAYLDLTGGKLALLSLATPTLFRAARSSRNGPTGLKAAAYMSTQKSEYYFF